MYKMVFKLVPPYLCDLCPDFVSERSSYSLRSANNLCLPFVRTERHKKSFLFSSIQEWNSLPLETRMSSSPGIFKRNHLKFLHFYPAAIFFILGIVQHQFFTLVWNNFSALNCHFFQKIAALHLRVLVVMHRRRETLFPILPKVCCCA